jgi:hypothetical protein
MLRGRPKYLCFKSIFGAVRSSITELTEVINDQKTSSPKTFKFPICSQQNKIIYPIPIFCPSQQMDLSTRLYTIISEAGRSLFVVRHQFSKYCSVGSSWTYTPCAILLENLSPAWMNCAKKLQTSWEDLAEGVVVNVVTWAFENSPHHLRSLSDWLFSDFELGVGVDTYPSTATQDQPGAR